MPPSHEELKAAGTALANSRFNFATTRYPLKMVEAKVLQTLDKESLI